MNANVSVETILKELDILFEYHKNVRMLTPYIPGDFDNIEGKLYTSKNSENSRFKLKPIFRLAQKMTKGEILEVNRMTDQLNQNFVIRICAFLEYYGFVKKDEKSKGKNAIDQNLKGWEAVDLIRRLRNYFAHTTGRLNSNDKEHMKTLKVLCDKFGLNQAEYIKLEQFPLSIDVVIFHFINEIKRYVPLHYKKYGLTMVQDCAE